MRVYRSQGGENVCGAVSCPTDVCHIDKPPKQKVISENKETKCLYLSEFPLFLDASANSNLPFLVGFRHQHRRRFPRQHYTEDRRYRFVSIQIYDLNAQLNYKFINDEKCLDKTRKHWRDIEKWPETL